MFAFLDIMPHTSVLSTTPTRDVALVGALLRFPDTARRRCVDAADDTNRASCGACCSIAASPGRNSLSRTIVKPGRSDEVGCISIRWTTGRDHESVM